MEHTTYLLHDSPSRVWGSQWIKCTNISAEKHRTAHALQEKNRKITNSFLSGLPPAEVRACKVRFLPYNFPAKSAVLRDLGFCNCRQKGQLQLTHCPSSSPGTPILIQRLLQTPYSFLGFSAGATGTGLLYEYLKPWENPPPQQSSGPLPALCNLQCCLSLLPGQH